jgi:putative membrane protein
MSNAVEVALLLLLLAACGVRARALRAAGGRFPNARLACVAAGAAVAIVAIYGLDGPGRRLLYWHTTQRLLIGDAAAPLIALGLAGASPPRMRRLLARRPSPLTQPWVALALWAVDLAVWQLPGPFDASMHHGPLRLLSNALLLILSVNMWAALLPGLSRRKRLGDAARIPYVLIGRLIGAGLACVAIWSPDVYYPYYLRGDAVSSTSPLADQGIAGAIMLAEMALVAIVLLCWLRARIGSEHATAARRPVAFEAELTPTSAAVELSATPAPAELTQAQAGPGALAVDVQT